MLMDLFPTQFFEAIERVPPVGLSCKASLHIITHLIFIQPPVIAQAVTAILGRCKDIAILRQTLRHLRRYYLWLQNRDFDSDGFISIIAPGNRG